MKKIIYCGLTCLSLLWVACNKDDDKKSLSSTDNTFVKDAALANRTEIEFGQMASAQSSNDGVKMFANMMQSEHQTALSDLQAIANDFKDASTVAPLDQEHQQLKVQLMAMNGFAFDSAYMQSQITDHQKTIAKFETEQTSGNEPRLKDYAAKYLPHIRMHLQKADSIMQALRH